MRSRHPIPRVWLMTDERMGDALWPALERLPRGAGVVFRHYATPDRVALFRKVAFVARRRRLVLLSAGGRLPGAAGTHNGRSIGLRSFSAHSRRELVAAIRAGADVVFVSPVYATRSHPDAQALGRVRLGLMIRGVRVPVIALGGMDAARFRPLGRLGTHGWAGVDAWV